jgi:hypothetical protein
MSNGCFRDQSDEANFEFYACFLGGIVCEGGTTSWFHFKFIFFTHAQVDILMELNKLNKMFLFDHIDIAQI